MLPAINPKARRLDTSFITAWLPGIQAIRDAGLEDTVLDGTGSVSSSALRHWRPADDRGYHSAMLLPAGPQVSRALSSRLDHQRDRRWLIDPVRPHGPNFGIVAPALRRRIRLATPVA